MIQHVINTCHIIAFSKYMTREQHILCLASVQEPLVFDQFSPVQLIPYLMIYRLHTMAEIIHGLFRCLYNR